MCSSAMAKGSSSMFIVPRRTLLKQTADEFRSHDIPFGYISSGYSPNPFAKMNLATLGSLSRRLDKVRPPKVAFIDECHWGDGELEKVIKWLRDSGSWYVGLSATPKKMNGKPMSDHYSVMEKGPTIRALIDSKRLSDYRMFAPSRPDLKGVKTVNGDYAMGQLSKRMETDRVLIGDAVKHYREHAMGMLNAAFCTSIKHAEITAEAFRNGGVPALAVSGKDDDDVIRRKIMAFARREVKVLCSAQLLTFGFDLSSYAQMPVTIECMSDLAPTKSEPLQRQKWGRPLRYKDYPAIIFDHAGNCSVHGMPDSEVDWNLDGSIGTGSGGGEKTIATRQCPSCFFVARPTASCPNCGHVYPVEGRMLEEVDGVLEEVTGPVVRPINEQGMQKSLDELIKLGIARGYAPGKAQFWAAKIISARMAKKRASR